MPDIFETMISRSRDCQQLVADIDLIRPETYEGDPPLERVVELINGAAAIYDLRFAALSDAYGRAVRDEGFFHYPIEECIMQWWGACDDLRCAAEGARNGVLDTDGIDNVLLGARSMCLVRAARFQALFDAARPAAAA